MLCLWISLCAEYSKRADGSSHLHSKTGPFSFSRKWVPRRFCLPRHPGAIFARLDPSIPHSHSLVLCLHFFPGCCRPLCSRPLASPARYNQCQAPFRYPPAVPSPRLEQSATGGSFHTGRLSTIIKALGTKTKERERESETVSAKNLPQQEPEAAI